MNVRDAARMDCIQDFYEGCPGASLKTGTPKFIQQSDQWEYKKAYAAQQFQIDTANDSTGYRGWKFDKERASICWKVFTPVIKHLHTGQVTGEIHGFEGPLYTIWETEGEYLVWSVMEV